VIANYLCLVLVLTAASAVSPRGFDTPEDAVRALEQAYVQKDVDSAVAAMDFVEEGRQMLQKNQSDARERSRHDHASRGRTRTIIPK